MSFLDVDVLLQSNQISTSAHVKSNKTFINTLSIHHAIQERVRTAFLTVRQNATDGLCLTMKSFSNALIDIRDFFITRNYQVTVIDLAFNEVCKLSQIEALMPSPKDKISNIIPFVIEYNPSIPNIGFIVNRYWD